MRHSEPIQLTLKTLPKSTNTLYMYWKGRRILTKDGRSNKEAMATEARRQYTRAPLAGPLRLQVELWWPTRRNHDIDNIKALLDSMTGILWEDDGQIVELHVAKGYDKGNSRVELSVGHASI